MEKYKCEICNKKHAVYYSSTGGIPKSVLDIRLKEETERIEELSEYLHLVDKKHVFVKGIIKIETTFNDYPITHEAWIEIPIKEYVSQIEQAKEKADLELYGTIASVLPFFQNIIGLEAKWVLDKENQFGEIIAQTESQLKEDQQNPITKQRMAKMMEFVHHPELHRTKKQFDRPFNERFVEVINKAKAEFAKKGKFFLIDISNLKEVLFQLISSEMLSTEAKGKIGIHISNDESNENYEIVKKEMSKISTSKMMKEFKLDEIETYQKSYAFTDNVLIEDVIQIIKLVYGEEKEELEIEIHEV